MGPLSAREPPSAGAVANFLGQKYDFIYQAVPDIRAALGLDVEAVQQAYLRLYRQPLLVDVLLNPRCCN
ncbi:MAG: hypothetical protein ACE5I2_03285 [Anaerolineae bacterium]